MNTEHDDGWNELDPLGIKFTSNSSGNHISNHQYDRIGQLLASQDF